MTIFFAILAGVIGFCIGWLAGASYGETECETKWMRHNADREIKAAQMPCNYNDPAPPPSFQVFDKKVAAKLKKSTKAKK
jgi:hypothetical protein